MDEYPVGEIVPNARKAGLPDGTRLEGRFVRLERPTAPRDSGELFAATHGADADPGQWTYMNFGPFDAAAAMGRWIDSVQDLDDPLFMVVRRAANNKPVGMASFVNVVPQHRTLELGNIWYAPIAQRSAVNTESVYLMLKESFDRLGYRRVEWKCDALNARSIASALRLGFSYEGIFRQHFIVKGRNRDTAWFVMLDSAWPQIKNNYERVLYRADCTKSLGELNAPLVPSRPALIPGAKGQAG